MERKKCKNSKSNSNIEAASELSPDVRSDKDRCGNSQSSLSKDRCNKNVSKR